jgi:hypothetical protein
VWEFIIAQQSVEKVIVSIRYIYDSLCIVEAELEGFYMTLEFSPPDCIALLFVALRQQGIAKGLLKLAISKACSSDPELSKLTVHSSPYAVPIYQKMGYRKTGEAAKEHGINYMPMELPLEGDNAQA